VNVNVNENMIKVHSEENKIKGKNKNLMDDSDCILLGLIEVVDKTFSKETVMEDFPAMLPESYFKSDEEAENNERLVSLPFITKPLISSSLSLLAVHKLWLLTVLTLHWMR
jgi:hypothetical protein